TVTFTPEQLAPFVGNGRLYEVDIFASYGREAWGWMGFDNLRVPGTLASYIPGDANGDGTVSVADMQAAIPKYTGFRSTVPVAKPDGLARIHGDMTGEGDVSVNDLQIMVANYGQSQSASTQQLVSPVAGAAVLSYNPANGVVTIDPANA